MTNIKDRVLPPVTPDDLVDANGNCAGAAASGAPPTITLEMTECDVVKLAGPADKVDIGLSERGERTATLSYRNGQRPGLYSFTAGRTLFDGGSSRSARTSDGREEAGQARKLDFGAIISIHWPSVHRASQPASPIRTSLLNPQHHRDGLAGTGVRCRVIQI